MKNTFKQTKKSLGTETETKIRKSHEKGAERETEGGPDGLCSPSQLPRTR